MEATRDSLLQRIRDRSDEASWREFVDIYRPLVSSYAKRFGASSEEAKDIVQDVFSTVVRRIGAFERRARTGSFRTWLRKMTTGQVRRMLAERVPLAGGTSGTANIEMLAQLPDPSTEVDEVWEEEWEKRKMDLALARVRHDVQERTWRAFELFTLEGRGAKEVADALGMNVGMVYVCKSRVMKRLRAIAAELEDED